MLISYILNRHTPKMLEVISTVERRSLRFKRTLFFVNISSFWLAGYFFLRHNSYCEPGGNLLANVQKRKLAPFIYYNSKHHIFFLIVFHSLHIICFNGVHSGTYEYGLPYDSVLGFSR